MEFTIYLLIVTAILLIYSIKKRILDLKVIFVCVLSFIYVLGDLYFNIENDIYSLVILLLIISINFIKDK